jgi:alginate O-acetyltransferase complex protein AlgI
VIIVSIVANYFFGLWIEKTKKQNENISRYPLFIAIIFNIILLISFKYANFITDNINIFLEIFQINSINLNPIHLPLGISFFTFQAISYLVDIYRQQAKAQKNILNLALYISLFPQLIAGPIVRYHDISLQITQRTHSFELFSSGIRRFIYGLSKKMLIANPLGEVADTVFLLSGNDLTLPLAWIGIIAYSLQILFDFSGYSDMAIGLGRMFGFKFQENFNYPYISKSLREFWQRWHISLSTWFKDYVYIPLGGNRVSPFRVYMNLLLVFIITGFWHGASWNFLIWGLFHGLFLSSEHAGFSKTLKRSHPFIQHFYVLLVVMIAWVFFRSETLSQAQTYIYTLFNMTAYQTSAYQFYQVISYEALYAFIMALFLSMPIYPWFKNKLIIKSSNTNYKLFLFVNLPEFLLMFSLFFISILKISSSTYNPFIYFRF